MTPSTSLVLSKDNCFILNLPNELLREILSIAIPYDFTTLKSRDHKLTSSAFHCIRAVCIRFRAVVAGLPFWADASYNLLTFRPRGVDDVQFLNDLFTDPGIVQNLSRRTSWDELNPLTLAAIATGVPSFRKHVESVSMELDIPASVRQVAGGRGEPFRLTMDILKSCNRLSSLWLTYCLDTEVDLDELTVALPSLTFLGLHSGPSVKGTLGLRNLRSFDVHVDGEPPHGYSPILPILSATTLHTLKIGTFPAAGVWDPNSFNSFVNVTTLHVIPMNIHVCELLLRFPARLREFRTHTSYLLDNEWSSAIEAMSSACLQTVETFSFWILERSLQHGSVDVFESCKSFINAVTKISTIRFLELTMPLDLTWYTYFYQLKNLVFLRWRVRSPDLFINPTFESLGMDVDETSISMTAETKSKFVFARAFRKLGRMPGLQFTIDVAVPPNLVDDDDDDDDDDDEEPFWEEDADGMFFDDEELEGGDIDEEDEGTEFMLDLGEDDYEENPENLVDEDFEEEEQDDMFYENDDMGWEEGVYEGDEDEGEGYVYEEEREESIPDDEGQEEPVFEDDDVGEEGDGDKDRESQDEEQIYDDQEEDEPDFDEEGEEPILEDGEDKIAVYDEVEEGYESDGNDEPSYDEEEDYGLR